MSQQQPSHEHRINFFRLTLGFAFSVILYFTWNATVTKSAEWSSIVLCANDLIKCLPVAALGIATWCTTGSVRWIPAALIFSAFGDLAGEHREFLLQIAMFAIAHIAYSIHFLKRAAIDKTAIALLVALCIAVVMLGVFIISHIKNTTEMIACGSYIVIIALMAGSAIVCRSAYRVWNIIAATLFIFSDSCIAINRFVEHIPHAGLLIMSTYFAAQYIFATVYLAEHNTQTANK